jgi:hypothetical protein
MTRHDAHPPKDEFYDFGIVELPDKLDGLKCRNSGCAWLQESVKSLPESGDRYAGKTGRPKQTLRFSDWTYRQSKLAKSRSPHVRKGELKKVAPYGKD